jgi:hypothetical protein
LSDSIRNEASQKFKKKAEKLIRILGECDQTAKLLLTYAKGIYPSQEIDELLKKCK